jgi:hypothetical protein
LSATTARSRRRQLSGPRDLSCRGCRRINFRNFAIDGNRAALEKPHAAAAHRLELRERFPNNGILIEDTDGLSVDHVDFANIAGFARSSAIRRTF